PVPAARYHLGGAVERDVLHLIRQGTEMAGECSAALLEPLPHGISVDHRANVPPTPDAEEGRSRAVCGSRSLPPVACARGTSLSRKASRSHFRTARSSAASDPPWAFPTRTGSTGATFRTCARSASASATATGARRSERRWHPSRDR